MSDQPADSSPAVVEPATKMDSHMKALFVLASIVMLMFFTMMIVLSFHEVPDKNKDLIDTLLGILGSTGFAGVVAFFFGTSASSMAKDTTIRSLASKQ